MLLLLVILLAGAYLVWTQALKKPLPWEKAKTAETKPVAPAPPPPPPPPPPAPSATLTEVPGTPNPIAAGRAGTIGEIVADGSTVAAGDVLARFAASPALTKQLAQRKQKLEVDLPKVIEDLSAKRDAATAAGKADQAKTFQDKIDTQVQARTGLEAEVKSLTEQLDAYAVKAPVAGSVKTAVVKGAKVTNIEQVIASITPPATVKATFTANPNQVFAAGDAASVKAKAAAGPPVSCKVTAVEGKQVTVECPSGGALAAGADVTLE